MLSKNIIVERLTAAGVDTSLADMIRQQMFYGGQSGEEAEDFLQEAIVTHLSGGDVKLMLGRLKNAKRYETNIEAMLGNDDEHEADAHTVLERESSDNERPDWIPNDGFARTRLWLECQDAIERSYKPRAYHDTYGYEAYLYLSNHGMLKQHIAWFESDKKRGVAERAALRRIMGWCNQSDDRWFTTECVKCSGPKSKYGVRFCRPCAKGGAIHEMNVLGRHA